MRKPVRYLIYPSKSGKLSHSLYSVVETNFGGAAPNWIMDGTYTKCYKTACLLMSKGDTINGRAAENDNDAAKSLH